MFLQLHELGLSGLVSGGSERALLQCFVLQPLGLDFSVSLCWSFLSAVFVVWEPFPAQQLQEPTGSFQGVLPRGISKGSVVDK